MTTSKIINLLDVHLRLIDIQMIIWISNFIKGVDGQHLDFLGHGASIISLLKGVKKEGREPLSEELPIISLGGLYAPKKLHLNFYKMLDDDTYDPICLFVGLAE